MSALVADVGMASGELKAVKNKLDSIMSLVFSMEAGKNQASRVCNPTPQSQDCIIRDDGVAAAASEGGSASFGGDAEDGNTASLMASAASTATARCGLGQWPLDGESAGGGIRRSGHDPYERGTLFDYRPTPRLSVDRHQHQDWQGHPLYSQLPEEPSPAERYPVAPDQVSEWTKRRGIAGPHNLARGVCHAASKYCSRAGRVCYRGGGGWVGKEGGIRFLLRESSYPYPLRAYPPVFPVDDAAEVLTEEPQSLFLLPSPTLARLDTQQ